MNCTDLDDFVGSLSDHVTENDVGFGVSMFALFLTSAALLVRGERLVRPLAAVVGGVAGAGAVFVLSRIFQPPPPCEVRLALAAVAAVVLSVLAVCVLKTGLFLLGAAGLGAIAHLVWESLPLAGVSGPFELASRPGWYYVAVGSASVVGAVVSRMQRKRFTRIASSVLGGSGLAIGIHLVYARNGTSRPPPALLLGVVAAAAIGGTFAQQRVERWRERRREGGGGGGGGGGRRRSRSREVEVVPMGRRVA